MSLRRQKSAVFDAATGLSWNETTVPSSRSSMCFRGGAGTKQAKKAGANRVRHTIPTLEELAIQSLLDNVDHVDVHTLHGLPIVLGMKLWKRIESANLTTPTVWAAFCGAFPEEEIFHYYTVSDILPQRTMTELITLLSSPQRNPDSYHWLTALTISNIDLTNNDILSLPHIPNLVALDIHSSASTAVQISNRTLRAWAGHATASDALSKLQVLIFRHQREVTSAALQYLNDFPNLALFGVKGCALTRRDTEEAEKQGWTTNDEHGILAQVNRDMSMAQSAHGMLYGCIRRSRCLLDTKATEAPITTNTSDSPILSYRLGRMDAATICHTSDESSPLIFFRSHKHDAAEAVAVQPPSTRASRDIWPHEVPRTTQVKRRKLRHSLGRQDVGEALKYLGMGIEDVRGGASSH